MISNIVKGVTVASCRVAMVAFAVAQDNPRYPALVDKCLTDWKGCLGTQDGGIDVLQCRACELSCGRQEISTPPNGTLCTQLRDFCRTYRVSPPPGPKCQSPTCVSYYNRCRREGPSSVACGYCGGACKSCPTLYTQCMGSAPPPVTPGSCPNEGCTYYETQCRRSPGIGTRFCGDCKAACIGVKGCSKQFDSCDKLNV